MPEQTSGGAKESLEKELHRLVDAVRRTVERADLTTNQGVRAVEALARSIGKTAAGIGKIYAEIQKTQREQAKYSAQVQREKVHVRLRQADTQLQHAKRLYVNAEKRYHDQMEKFSAEHPQALKDLTEYLRTRTSVLNAATRVAKQVSSLRGERQHRSFREALFHERESLRLQLKGEKELEEARATRYRAQYSTEAAEVARHEEAAAQARAEAQRYRLRRARIERRARELRAQAELNYSNPLHPRSQHAQALAHLQRIMTERFLGAALQAASSLGMSVQATAGRLAPGAEHSTRAFIPREATQRASALHTLLTERFVPGESLASVARSMLAESLAAAGANPYDPAVSSQMRQFFERSARNLTRGVESIAHREGGLLGFYAELYDLAQKNAPRAKEALETLNQALSGIVENIDKMSSEEVLQAQRDVLRAVAVSSEILNNPRYRTSLSYLLLTNPKAAQELLGTPMEGGTPPIPFPAFRRMGISSPATAGRLALYTAISSHILENSLPEVGVAGQLITSVGLPLAEHAVAVRSGFAGNPLLRAISPGMFAGLTGGALLAAFLAQQGVQGFRTMMQEGMALSPAMRQGLTGGLSPNDFINAVNQTGVLYAFPPQQAAQLTAELASLVGNRLPLFSSAGALMGLARGQGIDASTAVQQFGRIFQAGGFQGAPMTARQFADLIASAVSTGQMQGRQGEVLQSIADATQQLSQTLVGVPVRQITAVQAALNRTGIQGLMGQQGAALMQRVAQGMASPGMGPAGQLLNYRLLARPGMDFFQTVFASQAGPYYAPPGSNVPNIAYVLGELHRMFGTSARDFIASRSFAPATRRGELAAFTLGGLYHLSMSQAGALLSVNPSLFTQAAKQVQGIFRGLGHTPLTALAAMAPLLGARQALQSGNPAAARQNLLEAIRQIQGTLGNVSVPGLGMLGAVSVSHMSSMQMEQLIRSLTDLVQRHRLDFLTPQEKMQQQIAQAVSNWAEIGSDLLPIVRGLYVLYNRAVGTYHTAKSAWDFISSPTGYISNPLTMDIYNYLSNLFSSSPAPSVPAPLRSLTRRTLPAALRAAEALHLPAKTALGLVGWTPAESGYPGQKIFARSSLVLQHNPLGVEGGGHFVSYRSLVEGYKAALKTLEYGAAHGNIYYATALKALEAGNASGAAYYASLGGWAGHPKDYPFALKYAQGAVTIQNKITIYDPTTKRSRRYEQHIRHHGASRLGGHVRKASPL